MFMRLAPYDLADFIAPGCPSPMAEASTIQYRGAERLYDDACDVGIAVRSHRTGRVVHFYLRETDVRDDDTLGWHFEICPEDRRHCTLVELFIAND